MVRPLLWVALGASACVALGCSTTASRLKVQFARAQGCPEDQIAVDQQSGVIYRVSGCGKATEYVCGSPASLGDSSSNCSVRGANPHVPTGDPPPQNTSRPEYSSPK